MHRSDQILAAIIARARDPATRTDQADVVRTVVAPPVQVTEVQTVEAALGFPLPTFLGRVYREVGNGGFGPGYGLIGLPGGFTVEGHSILSRYHLMASIDPDDPAWAWPRRLLPLCHWGCGIYSCVNAAEPAGPVLTWDPNAHQEGQDPAAAIRTTNLGLEPWLAAWAAGTDLWATMYPSAQ